jgi:hypothetical protein
MRVYRGVKSDIHGGSLIAHGAGRTRDSDFPGNIKEKEPMLASMRTQRNLTFTAALTAALGLAFAGWTHITPARAQNDPAAPADLAQQPGGRMMMRPPATLAASGDFVYVLRGNTLYQMKSSDLSLVTQKDLPAPGVPGAAAAGGNAQ